MSSPDISGRAEIAAILGLAAQQDGPVRLLQPRDPALRKKCPGLFPSSKGKHGILQREMIGTMLEPLPGRPQVVGLTDFGIETLLRNTPQSERTELVERVSPLYRDRILSAWKRFATRGEGDLLSKSVTSIYGKWFPDSNQRDELEEFRELLAQEVADSWSDAKSIEARKRLARLLKILGAEPIGSENEPVKFTGLKHKPIEPLFKGDPARIVRPGWTFPKSPTPILLVKAEVSPA